MSVFKFFSQEAHARSFRAGNLLLRPLSYFRALEAEQGVRGDCDDGVLTYAPAEGLTLNMQDGRVIQLESGSFNAAALGDSIFVLCGTNQLSDDLADKFGRYCVEFDPEVIVARLRRRAHSTSRFDYEQTVYGQVDYRANHRQPGANWALPERLALTKPEAFAWQDEYRIAVPRRGGLEVHNVELTIQTGPEPRITTPLPPPAAVIVRVGSLAADAVLHRLEATQQPSTIVAKVADRSGG